MNFFNNYVFQIPTSLVIGITIFFAIYLILSICFAYIGYLKLKKFLISGFFLLFLSFFPFFTIPAIFIYFYYLKRHKIINPYGVQISKKELLELKNKAYNTVKTLSLNKNYVKKNKLNKLKGIFIKIPKKGKVLWLANENKIINNTNSSITIKTIPSKNTHKKIQNAKFKFYKKHPKIVKIKSKKK